MTAWMGIVEFLQEVDRLARVQSARLEHEAGPGPTAPPEGDVPCGELGPFTTQLLQVARSDAFEGSDSPSVQVLEAEHDPTCTHWQFWTERPEAA
jgi:hypothetical protein